jgi:WD40 repeat protein
MFLPFPEQSVWCSSDIQYTITAWEIKIVSHEYIVEEKFKIIGHTDLITNIVFVEEMNMLISSSFDGKLKFFDRRELNLVTQFELPRDGFVERSNETHGGSTSKCRPVVGMVFSKTHSNTFITWGFGTTIHLWNPYFSISNPYLSSYKPHAGIIKDCRFLNSSSFCVSLDNKLSLRI